MMNRMRADRMSGPVCERANLVARKEAMRGSRAIGNAGPANDLGDDRRPARCVQRPHHLVQAFERFFALPAGGYATAVLREFRKTDAERLQSDDRLGIEAGATDEAAPGHQASQTAERAPAPGRQD